MSATAQVLLALDRSAQGGVHKLFVDNEVNTRPLRQSRVDELANIASRPCGSQLRGGVWIRAELQDAAEFLHPAEHRAAVAP